MKITALSGGFGLPSTTSELTALLAREAVEQLGVEAEIIELRDVAGHLADATMLGLAAPVLDAALTSVETADLLIATTPTFRGTYAGLFKAFFDLVDPVAMRGRVVLLGATGGSSRHQLMIDHALRPLFSYFGSTIVPTAIYATTDDWQVGGLAAAELTDRARRALAQAGDLLRGGPADKSAGRPAARSAGRPAGPGTREFITVR